MKPVRYATSTAAWEDWQHRYRYGALYVFPPAGVIEPIDELRRRHDPKSHAICQAHISLSEPLTGPLTDVQLRELEHVLGRTDAFAVQYGPLQSFPPHPGVVYEIQPQAAFRSLRDAVHATSAFAGTDLPRHDVPPHMTIAEFISVTRTEELLLELEGGVPYGDFVCDAVELAVPDSNFRFVRQLRIPLGRPSA